MQEINPSKFSERPFERKVVQTEDGSSSIVIPEMGEMYHSRKGAIAESSFVYIDHGLGLTEHRAIRVLEVGFGTGLNGLLAFQYAKDHGREIVYHTLEPYPLTETEWRALNFDALLGDGLVEAFHGCPWNEANSLAPFFELRKVDKRLEEVHLNADDYDVVFYDAFAPNKQASPWVFENIQKCYASLKPGGHLVTYCAQGQFKRNLAEAGFRVTNPEGPLGKREITVAYK